MFPSDSEAFNEDFHNVYVKATLSELFSVFVNEDSNCLMSSGNQMFYQSIAGVNCLMSLDNEMFNQNTPKRAPLIIETVWLFGRVNDRCTPRLQDN